MDFEELMRSGLSERERRIIREVRRQQERGCFRWRQARSRLGVSPERGARRQETRRRVEADFEPRVEGPEPAETQSFPTLADVESALSATCKIEGGSERFGCPTVAADGGIRKTGRVLRGEEDWEELVGEIDALNDEIAEVLEGEDDGTEAEEAKA